MRPKPILCVIQLTSRWFRTCHILSEILLPSRFLIANAGKVHEKHASKSEIVKDELVKSL